MTYLTSCEFDVHGFSIERDSIVLLEGFSRVRHDFEDDFRCAQRSAAAIVVHVGASQLTELHEEFLGQERGNGNELVRTRFAMGMGQGLLIGRLFSIGIVLFFMIKCRS